ncbi:MAG TPA: phosphatase PAP2 family protein [Vitreimonas sp.]|uniref:phosphatase PAP2 family protein n=1 Tax=Vitreimonas sp. TaxID=3069702 RepID=UPI002D671A3E|nr:phosphatase PAP2 family protein [Vitreimonas sp.]HYD88589.1 phosphatase PAP2 family protein [Vitreimonas sp.]
MGTLTVAAAFSGVDSVRHGVKRKLGSLLELARREIVAVAAFFGAALALLGFAEITDEVTEGEGEARWFDESLLLALRTSDPADPIGPRWFEEAVAEITALGGFGVLALVTLLVLGWLALQKKWADAVLVLAATLGGTAISEGLKVGFARPRPDLVAHVADVTSMSFPSGHAMLSAVTYLTLGALLAHTQDRTRERSYILGAAIVMTLLIGMSRIYLGVHWPTDVLAGWCLGAAWALLCWLAATLLTKKAAPA